MKSYQFHECLGPELSIIWITPQCKKELGYLGSKMPIVHVRFSNRPFRVKRFQTIHHYSVDVAHGLALLFGIGTRGPCMALSLSRNLPGPRIFFLRRFLDLISKSVSSSRPAHR